MLPGPAWCGPVFAAAVSERPKSTTSRWPRRPVGPRRKLLARSCPCMSKTTRYRSLLRFGLPDAGDAAVLAKSVLEFRLEPDALEIENHPVRASQGKQVVVHGCGEVEHHAGVGGRVEHSHPENRRGAHCRSRPRLPDEQRGEGDSADGAPLALASPRPPRSGEEARPARAKRLRDRDGHRHCARGGSPGCNGFSPGPPRRGPVRPWQAAPAAPGRRSHKLPSLRDSSSWKNGSSSIRVRSYHQHDASNTCRRNINCSVLFFVKTEN